MAFVEEAKTYFATLPAGGVNARILEYLLQHAVGRANAQPWKAIDRHLREHGMKIRQQAFQHGLLKASRENAVFIGATDRGAAKGYFIIEDKADAESMREWYRRRIEGEQQHLDHLEALIAQEFPDDGPA